MPKMPLPPAESIKLDSLAEVARGGMGSVELARVVDGRLAGQILAVKRLHANIAEDPEFVSMFLDEAWVTAALKNPNVAQVVAWGNDDKGMFLAIELVQGVSLSRLIKEAQLNQEAFAERTVAFICSQICGGLVAAHTLAAPDGSPLGIVHRDLTPANVLISFDGQVKIIDFGIAKAEERISHTRTGQLKGKPAYMAPEQQRGGNVDARADLFAFGVVMFEMLAGRRPWTAKGAFDVMMEISNDPHPPLSDLRKGLNPEFVTIAHKLLEKKPEDRIQTAAELKVMFDRWLSAKGFSSDDQHSLAQFVLRNSQPQVLWWQEALRGEHAKKKAPTFKELEEKIDEEREKQAKAAKRAATPPPAPRPAAGLSAAGGVAPRPSAGTVPMQAYRTPSASPESGPLPPSSGSPARTSMMGGVGPSSVASPGQPAFGSGHYPAASGSGQYPGVAGSGQYPAVSGGAPGGAPAGPPAPVAQPKPMSHAGTEFMAISPFAAGGPLSESRPSYPNPPPGQPQQAQPLAPTYPGNESATVPMSPGLLMAAANATQPMPPDAAAQLGMVPAGARSTGMNFPPPQQVQQVLQGMPGAPMQHVAPAPPAQPAKRSRVGLVVVLIVIVLGAAGAGLWFFGDRIGLNLGGDAPPARSGKTK
jgi:serine/threonine protein kinase